MPLIFEAGPGLMIPSPGRGMVPYPDPPVPPGPDWTPIPAPDALAVLVDTCEFGQSGPCGCLPGGPPRACTRPDRPAEVPRALCRDCQSGAWPGGAPMPGDIA